MKQTYIQDKTLDNIVILVYINNNRIYIIVKFTDNKNNVSEMV